MCPKSGCHSPSTGSCSQPLLPPETAVQPNDRLLRTGGRRTRGSKSVQEGVVTGGGGHLDPYDGRGHPRRAPKDDLITPPPWDALPCRTPHHRWERRGSRMIEIRSLVQRPPTRTKVDGKHGEGHVERDMEERKSTGSDVIVRSMGMTVSTKGWSWLSVAGGLPTDAEMMTRHGEQRRPIDWVTDAWRGAKKENWKRSLGNARGREACRLALRGGRSRELSNSAASSRGSRSPTTRE